MLYPTNPVRSTAAGEWFLPLDGGAGSLLRVADGVAAGAVRLVRDLGQPGLLPIGNVVDERGQVWLRTPQPPGPALVDLLDEPLGRAGAAAVLDAVLRVVIGLHGRGLTHGDLDGTSVLLDPAGAAVVVLVEAGVGGRGRDRADVAGMAWVLAEAWCAADPAGATLLRRCGDLAEEVGPEAALAFLSAPGAPEPAGAAQARAAQEWVARLHVVPAPRSAADDASRTPAISDGPPA